MKLDLYSDNKGISAVSMVLIIPIGLLMLAWAIDGGYTWLRKVRLQAFADASAQAGISQAADLVVEIAETKDNPEGETDPILLLDDDDRAAIMSDASIEAMVNDYLNQNLDANNIDQAEIILSTTYPDQFQDCNTTPELGLDIYVELESNRANIFGDLFGGDPDIQLNESSRQGIRFCP